MQGVEWGFDGEARLTPLDWDYTGSSLIMNGRLRHTPFNLTRTISLRGHEVSLVETVRNVGNERIATMWGSQLTLGGDLLGPDTVLDTAATVVRPDSRFVLGRATTMSARGRVRRRGDAVVNLRSVPGPDTDESRLAYLGDFTRPWLRVTRPERRLGLDLEWDGEPLAARVVPAGGGWPSGFPWYRGGYFLSLTPSTSWPAHGLPEARRVADSTLSIPAGATRTTPVHPDT